MLLNREQDTENLVPGPYTVESSKVLSRVLYEEDERYYRKRLRTLIPLLHTL